MGNWLSCCCPEDDSEDARGGSSGGGAGDAYGANSETTPLLRDGSGVASAAGGSPDNRSTRLSTSQHHHLRDSRPAAGTSATSSSAANAASPNKPRVNEEQLRLNEILQDAQSKIIDCSAAASRITAGGNAAVHPAHGANLAGGASSSGHQDPAELQERAVAYGRRLAAKAKVISNKHLKPGPHGGLVDVGAAAGQLERMSGQPANEVLSEADHVLATELGSRAQEMIIDGDELEEDEEEVIVPFGERLQQQNFNVNNQ